MPWLPAKEIMDIPSFIKRFKQALSTGLSAVFTGAQRGSALGSVGMNQGKEQRLLAEVDRRKERAQQSGVIASAFTMYERDLPYYDAWTKNCPDLVHPQVKVIKQTEKGGGGKRSKRIESTIRGNDYVFTFRESTTFMPDGEPFTNGHLDVDFQGQRVMTIDCSCDDDRYAGRMWSANDVSAFIEGAWVGELNAVFAEVTHLHEVRDKQRQEKAKKEELEKLRRNFGL